MRCGGGDARYRIRRDAQKHVRRSPRRRTRPATFAMRASSRSGTRRVSSSSRASAPSTSCGAFAKPATTQTSAEQDARGRCTRRSANEATIRFATIGSRSWKNAASANAWCRSAMRRERRTTSVSSSSAPRRRRPIRRLRRPSDHQRDASSRDAVEDLGSGCAAQMKAFPTCVTSVSWPEMERRLPLIVLPAVVDSSVT